MTEKLREVLQKKELVHKGNYLEFYRDQVTLPNGKTAWRDYVHHPGAVAAVPVLANGDILLIKQFRYPTGRVLLEIPAGKLEEGEAPLEAIKRELVEEIGYEAGRIDALLSMWTTPGFTDEIMHLYVATDLHSAVGSCDPDEFLEIVRYSPGEVEQLLYSGEVVDGKTALALALFLRQRETWLVKEGSS